MVVIQKNLRNFARIIRKLLRHCWKMLKICLQKTGGWNRSGGARWAEEGRRPRRRRTPQTTSARFSFPPPTRPLAEARSRLDQRRFSRPNTHFSAFFKLYKKIIFSRANLQNLAKFHGILQNFWESFWKFSEKCKILKNVCWNLIKDWQNLTKTRKARTGPDPPRSRH